MIYVQRQHLNSTMNVFNAILKCTFDLRVVEVHWFCDKTHITHFPQTSAQDWWERQRQVDWKRQKKNKRRRAFVAIATGSGTTSLQTPDSRHTGKSEVIKCNTVFQTSVDMVWFGQNIRYADMVHETIMKPVNEACLEEFLTDQTQLYNLPPSKSFIIMWGHREDFFSKLSESNVCGSRSTPWQQSDRVSSTSLSN